MNAIVLTSLIFAAVFTAVGAFFDARYRRFPNWLTAPAAIGGLLFHIIARAALAAWKDESAWLGAWNGALFSLAGFALGFGFLFVLWLMGGAGGGDVKLMGALGTWLGFTLMLYVILASVGTMLLVGICVLAYRAMNKGVYKVKEQHFGRDKPPGKRKRLMPYGIPVALATWGVVAWALVTKWGG